MVSADNGSKLLFLAVCFVLMGVISAACQGPQNADATQPIIEDPDALINVTPEPTGVQYGYFTIQVKRVGVHRNVGWYASGEVYVKTSLDLGQDDPADTQLVKGIGWGKAGFDVGPDACRGWGGWPVEYSAEGTFSARDCTLTIAIKETWPFTTAYAFCLGVSNQVGGPPYLLTFPNLIFFPADSREDTAATVDQITWTNTFIITRADGLEDADCRFVMPTE